MAKVTIANLKTLLDDVVTSNIAVQDAQYAVTNATVKAEQATTSAQAAAATKVQVDNQLVLIEEFANAINDDVQENDDIKEVILGLEAAIAISESAIELTKDNIAVMLSEVITSKSDIDIKAELVNEWVADFHTKYLGASLEAPNASWDGMELATGMIYYDIAKNSLMIYINTNIWVPIIEAVNMLVATNNLADLLDKPLARTNLGVLSVAEVEANIQADIAAIKGKPLGLAELDANGLVPAGQLPSYVDDVLEVATKADLPVIGETGKIYVVVTDESSNGDTSSYRWTGSVYAMVSNTLTAADVKALYESNLNTNVYTDAEKTKVGHITVTQVVDLDTIESDTSLNNTHRTSNGTDHTYIDQDVTTTATPTFAGLVTTGLVDGRDVSVDGLKLDGIEAGATADQTKSEIDALGIDAATVSGLTVETAVPVGALFTDTTYTDANIKTKYENNLDTNAFTDAEKTKLANQSGINTGDQDLSGKADIATTLAGYGIGDAYTKTEIDTLLAGQDQVASEVPITPVGNIIATNVQTALEELDSEKVAVTSYTAADVLAKLITVDGSGSLLDADTLDGMEPSALPISTATQGALDLKAPLASPALTGTPTAPTAVVGTNTTQLATTEFVQAEIANDAYSKTQLDAGQLDNRYYTEIEINTLLAAQNDASEIAVIPAGNLASTNVQAGLEELQGDVDVINDANISRADKYLAGQDIAAMSYDVDGNLAKIQYNNATDVDYEVFGYTTGNLSSITHYVGSVLKGTTTLSYSGGNLVSSIFVGA